VKPGELKIVMANEIVKEMNESARHSRQTEPVLVNPKEWPVHLRQKDTKTRIHILRFCAGLSAARLGTSATPAAGEKSSHLKSPPAAA